MKKFIVLTAFTLLLMPIPCWGVAMSSQDRAQALSEALAYLNSLKNFRVPFVQIDESGLERTGTLSVSRPLRMRADYDEPFKDIIIIDRGEAFFRDAEANSHYRFDSSLIPLIVLLEETISLGGDYYVSDMIKEKNILALMVQSRDENVAGALTLVFDTKPYRLLRWILLDSIGARTRIELGAVELGASFPQGFFDIQGHIPERTPFGVQ